MSFVLRRDVSNEDISQDKAIKSWWSLIVGIIQWSLLAMFRLLSRVLLARPQFMGEVFQSFPFAVK